jgi:hypothetical protein
MRSVAKHVPEFEEFFIHFACDNETHKLNASKCSFEDNRFYYEGVNDPMEEGRDDVFPIFFLKDLDNQESINQIFNHQNHSNVHAR